MTIKLLILEDLKQQQRYFLQTYKEEIKTKNYELIFTQTGEEALETINNDRDREIDLIIADLKLPGAQVDGWQFIKTLSKNSIDIKIIVITAWGHLDNFSEQERKNIIYFIERNTEEDDLELIKERIELVLDLPDRFTIESKKVRFNTLLKAAKDLPTKQKIKLIEKLLSFSDLKELRQLQTKLPQLIEQSIDGAIERDRIRRWLSEKEKNGQIEFFIATDEGTQQKIPVRNLNYFYIDRKTRNNSTYCEIRWWWEGSLRYTNVPKYLLSELLPLLNQTS